MKLETLKVLPRAAAFEIECESSYFAPAPYTMTLNGEPCGGGNTNVVTLFSLKPSMSYRLRLELEDGSELWHEFITPPETMSVDIRHFGAVGDGVFDCTGAIQAAVSCCPAGGTVYIPNGCFLSYPIFLKSGVTLYLERGARLLGGLDRSRYPVLAGMLPCAAGERSFGTWEGNPLDCYASLITAIDCQNIAITGPGSIDGNAQASDWWHDAKLRRGAWRPRTIFLNGCNDVTLLGFSVGNSPSWTIHPYYCDRLNLLGLTINNPEDSPNTDGCDPECCRDVQIIGAHISVGDDCISFKSGKYYMGRHHYRRAEGLLVRNCLMDKGHGAVVLGSEIASGLSRLQVERCIMRDTDRGLRIKTRRGRGDRSIIDDISFSHITMERVKTPFTINMFYYCDPDGHSNYVESKTPLPVDHLTPAVGTLYCNDITCTGCQYAGAFLYGLPERPIDNVVFSDVHIAFDPNAQEGMPAMLDGVAPMKRQAVDALNVRRLTLKNVTFQNALGNPLRIFGVQELIDESRCIDERATNVESFAAVL